MRLLHFHFNNQNKPLKGTGAKRDVCRGSSVSARAKFSVARAESSPIFGRDLRTCDRDDLTTKGNVVLLADVDRLNIWVASGGNVRNCSATVDRVFVRLH